MCLSEVGIEPATQETIGRNRRDKKRGGGDRPSTFNHKLPKTLPASRKIKGGV